MVRDENLKFMKNRDVYNSDYFSFTLSLASVNAVNTESSFDYCLFCKLCILTALIFELYLFTDKVKASILSGHGKNQSAACRPVPLPHVPANQKETQVRHCFCSQWLNSRLVPVVVIIVKQRRELLVKTFSISL